MNSQSLGKKEEPSTGEYHQSRRELDRRRATGRRSAHDDVYLYSTKPQMRHNCIGKLCRRGVDGALWRWIVWVDCCAATDQVSTQQGRQDLDVHRTHCPRAQVVTNAAHKQLDVCCWKR